MRDIHFAANLLDPKFRGVNITSEEELLAMECICRVCSSKQLDIGLVMAELSCFKTSLGGIFTKDFVWEAAKCCPSWIWWQGICSSTKLSSVASSILSLPATSNATERSFSTYGTVHTKSRNRLTIKRASMLAFVRHNLKLLPN